jgi:3-deoxy-D-manno-octulosonic-acid transferase
MRILYSLSIHLYGLAIWLSSFFKQKSKLWIDGRNNWEEKLVGKIPKNRKVLWMHCSSLGEFEQGRTVIEHVKKSQSNIFILLTFFSPSGYEVRKNYEYADAVVYLPLDTKYNARKFIDITNPSLVIFVKYEFWFNYIFELSAKNIPLLSISAIFRVEHYFFKWYGAWFLKYLSTIQMFFVQDETSKKMLLSSKINQVKVSGDTRFDRVYEISKSIFADDIVSDFSKNSFLIIAGSSWDEDELILRRFYEENQSQNIKIIIAPHHVDSENISRIISEWYAFNPVLYSQINSSKLPETNVMVIDCIGKLMQIYKYGNLAFVGGGFGKGIHNVLEPATFGLPIAFGPNFNKFKEANDLISLDVATVINSSSDFKQFAELQNNYELYVTKSKTATKYVTENIGATDVIVDYIAKIL